VTACPTSGLPYEDKPRLYLNQVEFDAQDANAFMVRHKGDEVTITARFAGETHRMSVNGSVEYVSPAIVASFDGAFNLLSTSPGEAVSDGSEISLEPAATMFALWKGLDASMPELPVAQDAGTRIGAPTL
jgi:hypothetical protein